MRLMNFFKSKKFKQKEYAEDKNNLISAFNEQGFRDARILKDTIYYISDDRLGIDFTLEEGDRYYFRDITWTGNSIYSADQLNQVLRIKKGDIYDLVTMDKRLSGDPKQMEPDVRKMYTDNGYLFFNVMPVEKAIQNDSVDVEMRIYEGKPATFNKIIIGSDLFLYMLHRLVHQGSRCLTFECALVSYSEYRRDSIKESSCRRRYYGVDLAVVHRFIHLERTVPDKAKLIADARGFSR